MDDRTAVLIGVGEASERIDEPTWRGLSPADLAAAAAAAAIADASARDPLAPHIDVVAAVRQFETSSPRAEAPFGRSDNFPRAVARRIGADPARAILEPVGGQGPQHLVNEFARAIAKGEAGMVLLCGAEAISTIRHLASRGEKRDWSEDGRRRAGGPRLRRGPDHRRAGSSRRAHADHRLRPVRERPPRPARPLARGLRPGDGPPLRAVHPRRRRQPPRHVARGPHARGAGDGDAGRTG